MAKNPVLAVKRIEEFLTNADNTEQADLTTILTTSNQTITVECNLAKFREDRCVHGDDCCANPDIITPKHDCELDEHNNCCCELGYMLLCKNCGAYCDCDN